MNEILFTVCFVCVVCAFGFLFWHMTLEFDKQRAEWNEERAQLLDRIQAGNFAEYKAQARADAPKREPVKKDPQIERLEREPWA